MKSLIRGRGLALVTVFVLMACWSAHAASPVWKNTSGGDFSVGANWSTGVAPGGNDYPKFLSNATYTVTFPSSMNTTEAHFYAAFE